MDTTADFREFIVELERERNNKDVQNVELKARDISLMITSKYTMFDQNRIIQLIVKNIQDIREEKLKDIRRSESEMIEAMKGLNKSIRE